MATWAACSAAKAGPAVQSRVRLEAGPGEEAVGFLAPPEVLDLVEQRPGTRSLF